MSVSYTHLDVYKRQHIIATLILFFCSRDTLGFKIWCNILSTHRITLVSGALNFQDVVALNDSTHPLSQRRYA